MTFTLVLLSALVFASVGLAQEEEDEDVPKVRPGVVGHYEAADGTKISRLDRDLHFNWRDAPPDRRLASGPFSVRWQGRLFATSPGRYVLQCYAAGEVQLSINGKVLLHSANDTPTWMKAEPVTLDYGYHPLVIEYRSKPGSARFGLYWSGEKFQLEPVPDRHLFHDPQQSPDEGFEQGQLLARALRCAACHELPGEQAALTAPALPRLRGNLSPQWVIDWLQQSPPVAPPDQPLGFVPRRMPHLALEANDAQAIAAYLFDASEPAPPVESVRNPAIKKPEKTAEEKPAGAANNSGRNKNQKKVTKKPKARTEPSAAEGEMLVDTIGCLTCHRVEKRGSQALFGGGNLSAVADKRPADFFSRWLADPEKINPAHRMPVFALESLERADLALYLSDLHVGKAGSDAGKDALPTAAAMLARGRELVATHRCGACHQLPGATGAEPVRKTRLTAASHWDASCLDAPDGRQHRPGYALTAVQRAGRQNLSDLAAGHA